MAINPWVNPDTGQVWQSSQAPGTSIGDILSLVKPPPPAQAQIARAPGASPPPVSTAAGNSALQTLMALLQQSNQPNLQSTALGEALRGF